ncbi:MAG: acyltransferase [Candidatus Omnitrophica bacterium]|nr:acyltransferase [Candidatus Omnitrophota bacterium]
MFQLDEDFDPKMRNQILLHYAASVLSDRERARLFGLPEGCRIRERAKILNPENFKCGKYVWIGEGAVLDAQGGLTIGDYTQVGLNVMVWSHHSYKAALMSQTCKSKKGITYKPTKIGNNCFISGPTVIDAGVTIGDRVLVSPFTFIDKDIPDDTVVSSHRDFRDLMNRVKELEDTVARLSKMVGSADAVPESS